ncbi:MAG: four helix bundle protein [Sedimentisphaerales bacterium]|nr:four helix bundle protein [Sedimentisphaerales bacterium]
METKRAAAKSFKDLIVWQKAYKLVLKIYKVTVGFPKFETYGLAQQIRRAAVSIPSNIAEGYCRKHSAEYKQFLSIAYASLAEVETQYLLSIDLGYINQSPIIAGLLKEVGSMLYCMINPKT